MFSITMPRLLCYKYIEMAGQKIVWWKRLLVVAVLSASLTALIFTALAPAVSAQVPGRGTTYSFKGADRIAVAGWYTDHNNYPDTANFDFECQMDPRTAADPSSVRCTAILNANGQQGTCVPYIENFQKVNGSENYSGTVFWRTDSGGGNCRNAGSAPIPIVNTAANPGGGSGTGDSENNNLLFECGQPFSLNWWLCPIYWGLNRIVGAIDGMINSMLYVDQVAIFSIEPNPDGSKSSGQGYYQAWQALRTIALALLVISALVMVIAQALGFQLLDAYTIKKVMPRLVIAVIAIALSWQLMEFLVELTNALGLGVRQIIYYPFADMPGSLNLGGGGAVTAGLLTVGAFYALGPVGLLSFAATAAMAGAIAFLVLMLRQLVIIVLILMAPIAIACSILPNTQGAYKLWYESFTKALLMFPIIVAFIAVGRVFSVVALQGGAGPDAGGVVGTGVSAVSQIIGFAAYFLPYFLIPMTFSLAGGAMRFLGGKVNDTGRGGFDRLKKFRQGQFAEHGGRRIEDGKTRVMQKQADYGDRLLSSASRVDPRLGRVGNAIRRTALRKAAGGIGGYNIEAKMSARRAQVAKELNDQIATGRDEEIRASTVDKKSALQTAEGDQWRMADVKDAAGNVIGKSRQFKTLGGAWFDEAYVDRGIQRWGKDTFANQAALSYEMRKANSEDELENLKTNYERVAKNAWGMSDGEAQGAWIGAAFENQNAHLEFKKTDWKTGQMSESQRKGFVDEIYEKKGSYPLAQMGSHTIKMLEEAYEAKDTSNETKQKIRAVAETFVSRYGGGAGGIISDEHPELRMPGGGGAGTVTTNTAGAAHVAERVNRLAKITGAYQPTGPTENITNAGYGTPPGTENVPVATPPQRPGQQN